MEHLTDQEIQELMDGGNRMNRSQKKHLESCAECRKQLGLYRTIADELSSGESIGALDDGFSGRVIRRIPVHYKTVRFVPRDLLLFGLPWIAAFTVFILLVDSGPVVKLFGSIRLPDFSFEPLIQLLRPVHSLISQKSSVYIGVVLAVILVSTADHLLLRSKRLRH